MWHVTRDMWHVTRDTSRDVTLDAWHVTCLGVWTFSQNFSSLAPTVCDLWYYEYLEEKDDAMNQLISDEAVYRTAQATPGLLIIVKLNKVFKLFCPLLSSPIGWLRSAARQFTDIARGCFRSTGVIVMDPLPPFWTMSKSRQFFSGCLHLWCSPPTTCHRSGVRWNMSPIYFSFFSSDKLVGIVGGGSVTNGDYPV